MKAGHPLEQRTVSAGRAVELENSRYSAHYIRLLHDHAASRPAAMARSIDARSLALPVGAKLGNNLQ